MVGAIDAIFWIETKSMPGAGRRAKVADRPVETYDSHLGHPVSIRLLKSAALPAADARWIIRATHGEHCTKVRCESQVHASADFGEKGDGQCGFFGRRAGSRVAKPDGERVTGPVVEHATLLDRLLEREYTPWRLLCRH
jgi:hypothetical protein